MPFTLRPVVPAESNVFSAPTGSQFTIGAEATGASVVIQAASYAGDTKTAAPFTFTSVADTRTLTVVYAVSDMHSLVLFNELNGTDKQPLGMRLGTQTSAMFTIN